MQNKKDFKCQECGNEFKAYLSQKRKYCSNKCRLKALHRETPGKKRTGKFVVCEFCKENFYIAKWKIKKNKGKFCSRKCYGNYKSILFKGKGNPKYIDGRVKKYSKAFYLSSEWRNLRKEIYKRDNYKCQNKGCNSKSKRLHAHHKIPVGKCKDPFDKKNIITLCHACHCKTQRR